MSRVPLSFYRRDDVVEIARDLLGKYLLTCPGGRTVTGGVIVETEAYGGVQDRASHAYGGRRTRRTETMYCAGGVTYVYLCYGIHSLLNIVTNAKDVPDAVLIRAIEPETGVETMLRRRKRRKIDKTITSGPGTLTVALGVSCEHDGERLSGRKIWIEDRGVEVRRGSILAGPRVGVDYAGEDAGLPWRFRLMPG